MGNKFLENLEIKEHIYIYGTIIKKKEPTAASPPLLDTCTCTNILVCLRIVFEYKC